MVQKILNFLSKNFWTILKIGFAIFILYYLIFFLTPNVGMQKEQKQQIDSLNTLVKKLHDDNIRLEGKITNFESEIGNIDNNISNIKKEKTIIKEYYHEKINSVDKLTIAELDSFFSKRYGY